MSKLLFGVFLVFLIALIHENNALLRGNNFETRKGLCERRCRLPFPPRGPPSLLIPIPGQQRNEIKTCLVLSDHNNITVPLCVASCLENKINLGSTIECQCQNNKCILPTPSPDTSTTTTTSTTGSPSSTSSSSSTTVSSTSISTTTPVSTSSPSTTIIP